MNLFLTVGSQMPFDRLTAAVAAWARSAPEHHVVAQVGRTELSTGQLEGLHWRELMSPSDYARQCAAADLIVAHAGMGSVLTAMETGRHLLMMPRRGALRETRNDHQVATALRLRGQPGLHVAMEPDELAPALNRLCAQAVGTLTPRRALSTQRLALIDHLRGVITNARR